MLSIPSVLVQCAISGNDENRSSNFSVSVYADMVRITNNRQSAAPYFPTRQATRGAISEFSRRSRKRMLERLAMARNIGAGGHFLTLTYLGEYRHSPDDVKQHLFRFRKALIRRFPGSGGFWRMELKPRLSGRSAGVIVPHFHLLLFGANPRSLAYMRRWVRVTWSRIIAIPDEPRKLARTQTDVITTRKHAARYASKYAAKVEETDEFGQDAQIAGASSWGRHWGYFGSLDFACAIQFQLSQQQIVDFKRLVRGWLKSRKQRFHKRLARIREDFGYSIFGLGDLSQDLPPPIDELTITRMLTGL